MVGQLDDHYQEQAKAYNAARQSGYMAYRRGHHQPTRIAFQHYFGQGFLYGALFGTIQAMHYRKIMLIPKVGLAAGMTYGTIMAISQAYRHDI